MLVSTGKIIPRVAVFTCVLWQHARADAPSTAPAEPPAGRIEGPGEIIVVAGSLKETEQSKAPYSISSVLGKDLEDTATERIDQLMTYVTGLNVAQVGQREAVNNNLVIRGINANNPGLNNIVQNMTESTVAMYLGSVPIFVPIRLVDVGRIEVLRGPQGTLYGSGSVGGLLHVQFNEPVLRTGSMEAAVHSGLSQHSTDPSYGIDAIANVPIGQSMAVRAVAGLDHLGGVVDANGLYATRPDGSPVLAMPNDLVGSGPVLQPRADSDAVRSWYARASLLLVGADAGRVLISAFHQSALGDGDSFRTITGAGLAGIHWQNTERLLGTTDIQSDLLTIEASTELEGGKLVSATGIGRIRQTNVHDISGLYQRLDDLDGEIGHWPRLVAYAHADQERRSLTEELRYVRTENKYVNWAGGVFLAEQDLDQLLHDEVPGWLDYAEAAGVVGMFGQPRSASFDGPFVQDRTLRRREAALFGEFEARIVPQLRITGGARLAWQNFDHQNFTALPFCGAACSNDGIDPLGVGSDLRVSKSFLSPTFKIGGSYEVDPQVMVYALRSEGFRHGGANALPTAGVFAVNPSLVVFEPEHVANYELGLKGIVASRVRYQAAAFRMNIDKPQIDTFLGPLSLPGVLNADRAHSQGAELEVSGWYGPIELTAGYTLLSAKLDGAGISDGGSQRAPAGARLPGVPNHMLNGNVSFTHALDPQKRLRLFAGGYYRGGTVTNFNMTFRDYTTLPGFAVLNAGAQFEAGTLSLLGLVDNISDSEQITGVRIRDAAFSRRAFVGRPRTFGVEARYRF